MFLKLNLKSLDKALLLRYISFLKKRENSMKLVYLPKKKVRFTILASPHVNIRAREHYEFQITKCFIYLNVINFIIPPAGIAYKILFTKKFI